MNPTAPPRHSTPVRARLLFALLLLVLAACSAGSSDGGSAATTTVQVAGTWSGSYNTASSTGSLRFELTQSGARVGGTCHLVNKIDGRAVDFTLIEGSATSTGFTFTMRQDPPLAGVFSGIANLSGEHDLSVRFRGQDATGSIEAAGFLTSERGQGAWIGSWQSPQLPPVGFALRLEQAGSNLVGRMVTFQSVLGVPMVFLASGSIAGEQVSLALRESPEIQIQPPANLGLTGLLSGDTLEFTWSGSDGFTTHVSGAGVASRATPFRPHSSSPAGVYAGMIGSTEWVGFAVLELHHIGPTRFGVSVVTTLANQPLQFFGTGLSNGYQIHVLAESVTTGAPGLLNLRIAPQGTGAGYGAQVQFTGQTFAGSLTNGEWFPLRI